MYRPLRRPIVGDVEICIMVEEGRARLVFESASSFEGTLETATGEIFSIKSLEGARGDDERVNIQVIDGETGEQFLIEEAAVKYDDRSASIDHPSLNFESDKRLIGMKARREIQEHLNHRLAMDEGNRTVITGNMKIKLQTNYDKKPVVIRKTERGGTPLSSFHAPNDFFA